jgi:RNA polymerase sigma-70 factor (ECF subfamily)
VAADEEHARVRAALESMSEVDREVLVLRHFEQLTNAEVSRLLEITPQTASARYVKALTRIQSVVGEA